MLSGILLVDKPCGITSFRVVSIIKTIFNTKKVGHAGTLDPMATGLLPILINKATKAQEFLQNSFKEYQASFKLGVCTDTQDITGKVLKKIDNADVTENKLRETLKKFEGFIDQTPPMYSAISKNGIRLYKLARKGIEVEREKRRIEINKIELLKYNPNEKEADILVSCSKGTYVRTLCSDIGDNLGVGATLTKLRRTKTCNFSIENSIKLSELEESKKYDCLKEYVIPIDNLFFNYCPIFLNKIAEKVFLNGGKLSLNLNKESSSIRVYNRNKFFLGLGIYKSETKELYPKKIFFSE